MSPLPGLMGVSIGPLLCRNGKIICGDCLEEMKKLVSIGPLLCRNGKGHDFWAFTVIEKMLICESLADLLQK